MPERGIDSVTVPGAVAGWVELSKSFGKLPFAELAKPAINYARQGFQVTPKIASLWEIASVLLGKQPGFAKAFLPRGEAPRPGAVFKCEPLAASLEQIAETNGQAFYTGALADELVAFSSAHGGAMSPEDLASHRAERVEPLSAPFLNFEVQELPPNGQGIAALIALRIIEAAGGLGDDPGDIDTLHTGIEAMKLAFADVTRHVADPRHMICAPEDMLAPDYIASRAALIDTRHARAPVFGAPKRGGTVYLAAADAAGQMVSFIQSNYLGFGSGCVTPGGISLQNRGAGFAIDPHHVNVVGPRKRPFHTIIPAFATGASGAPLMAFGVMGGTMQAQGHVQMALRILRYGQDPQAAAEGPRWRVLEGRRIAVEPAMGAATIEALRSRGHDVLVASPDTDFGFGGTQLILKTEGGYVAGSDPRKDGQAVAF